MMQKYFYLFLLALVPVPEADALMRSSLSAIKQSPPCDLIPLCSPDFDSFWTYKHVTYMI